MTSTEIVCPKGPNNFAMIPRIAMIELIPHELSLYANLLDLAHPKTHKAQLSNKRLASRVGCTVKTLKKHRNRLCELGYIRLFYRDHYGQLVAIDDTANTETWDAIIVEVIDIWDANCQFTEAYKNKPDDKLAILKKFLPTSQTDLKQGGKNLQGDELQMNKQVKSVPALHILEGGVNYLQGSVKTIHPVGETNTSEGDQEMTPNIINKDLVKENKKTLEKNILRDERDVFLLDDIFPEVLETSESDTKVKAQPEEIPVAQLEPEWDKPYTAHELEYFKDSVSLSALETDVFNPCHRTSELRSSFAEPTKDLSNWQQLLAVVEEFFPSRSRGYATTIAQQLAGTAKSGQRKTFGITPAMDATEACAFAYWLQEGEGLDNLPERAERIQERAIQFRALPNHFEHINFARYILADLMASKETTETLEIDPNLFKPAPKEVLDKVYAEAEALLGFSLSGDF